MMKKIVWVMLAATLSLVAAEKKVDGEQIFEKHCAACHIKVIHKEELMKIIKSVKAPPMIEVSAQLKKNIKIVDDIDDEIHRAVVVAFIKDYIQYPHLDKSMCTGAALERFGVMPSLKGKLTDEEINAVSAWVYDYYVGKTF